MSSLFRRAFSKILPVSEIKLITGFLILSNFSGGHYQNMDGTF